MNTNKILIYPELSYLIVGICYSVHNELGNYFKEKQYSDKIEEKLKEAKANYTREQRISDCGNITDFIIDKKIILEIKVKRILTKDNYYQLQRYLQDTRIKLGLLVNFRNKYLKPSGIVRIDTDNKRKFIS